MKTLALEVADFEDGGSGLSGSPLQFWSMDLCEALGSQELPEEVLH